MERHFHHTQRFGSNIYVADYTQYAKEHPEYGERKVEITQEKPKAINSLDFYNPNHIKVTAINFEKNPSIFKSSDNEKNANCECMLVPEECVSRKNWLALVELKYCKGEIRNIVSNFLEALQQVRDTFLYLRDKIQLFGKDTYRYYWVIAMPDHDDKVPFSAFVLSPDDIMAYKECYNATIISDNKVNIWTTSVIRMPKYDR